jgi:hypothetical protein
MEVLMRKFTGLALATTLLAAGIWTSSNLFANNAGGGMSAYEIHLRTNVKDLPVQVNEDAF